MLTATFCRKLGILKWPFRDRLLHARNGQVPHTRSKHSLDNFSFQEGCEGTDPPPQQPDRRSVFLVGKEGKSSQAGSCEISSVLSTFVRVAGFEVEEVNSGSPSDTVSPFSESEPSSPTLSCSAARHWSFAVDDVHDGEAPDASQAVLYDDNMLNIVSFDSAAIEALPSAAPLDGEAWAGGWPALAQAMEFDGDGDSGDGGGISNCAVRMPCLAPLHSMRSRLSPRPHPPFAPPLRNHPPSIVHSQPVAACASTCTLRLSQLRRRRRVARS